MATLAQRRAAARARLREKLLVPSDDPMRVSFSEDVMSLVRRVTTPLELEDITTTTTG